MKRNGQNLIHAAVAVADGTEEMEAVICIDIFRRAGWKVEMVGLTRDTVIASRGVRLIPDIAWSELDVGKLDLLVIPGGIGGTKKLMQNDQVLEAIRAVVEADKFLASVCAGPLVLQQAGVLEDRKVTCHPSSLELLTTGKTKDKRVVIDGKLITSQGPGTTMDFALRVVAEISGPDQAAQIAAGMVHRIRG